ncbi:ankyrin repeat-containing domain protein [Lactarius hatsudake]|nr:ankyrin repeat-containing domain protein [Lactarius hatsudake]
MDLGIRDIYNRTLLHAASGAGYVDIVQWLFDHGVSANSQQDDHEAPAEANWLLGRSITVDDADNTNHTPLHSASSGGHFEIVRQLLVRGADVTAKTQRHWSPLHLASYSRDAETVRLLIEHGADVTARDRRHKTPLHSVLFLHDGFMDVTALDMTHSTPLDLASSLGIPRIVQILLESGADANAQNETHSTPLHRASIREESSECVRILIEHGADVTARDWNRKTPLHIASSWDEHPMSGLFQEGLKEKNPLDAFAYGVVHWER